MFYLKDYKNFIIESEDENNKNIDAPEYVFWCHVYKILQSWIHPKKSKQELGNERGFTEMNTLSETDEQWNQACKWLFLLSKLKLWNIPEPDFYRIPTWTDRDNRFATLDPYQFLLFQANLTYKDYMYTKESVTSFEQIKHTFYQHASCIKDGKLVYDSKKM